jgi:hypothetical protein
VSAQVRVVKGFPWRVHYVHSVHYVHFCLSPRLPPADLRRSYLLTFAPLRLCVRFFRRPSQSEVRDYREAKISSRYDVSTRRNSATTRGLVFASDSR